MLTDRQKSILKAIVDDFVETAEPVGSKALLERHKFGVSSATIRNEMSDLENSGYLEKPHTSSGRIPSDKGYRAYIDNLLELKPVSPKEQEGIEGLLDNHLTEFSDLLKKTVNVLSEQTDYPAMMISPYYKETSLEQIKLLMIEPGKVLVVVVLSPGIVKDRLIRISNEIDQAQLNLINKMIEEKLRGERLEQITMIAVNAAAEDAPIPEAILNQILFEAYVSIKQAENIDFYLKGSHRLLSQPEFHEIDTAQKFFETIHKDGLIAGYMSEWDSHPRFLEDGEVNQIDANPLEKANEQASYMVRIGQEIALDGLEDCSFITATYNISDKITGRIGVVGPKRMSYDKIISQINFVNYTLDKQISKFTNKYYPEENRNAK